MRTVATGSFIEFELNQDRGVLRDGRVDADRDPSALSDDLLRSLALPYDADGLWHAHDHLDLSGLRAAAGYDRAARALPVIGAGKTGEDATWR